MGKLDRGAFGQLLDEAKELGCKAVTFGVDLECADDHPERWVATDGTGTMANGRTGEEAFRAFIAVKRRG